MSASLNAVIMTLKHISQKLVIVKKEWYIIENVKLHWFHSLRTVLIKLILMETQ